MIPYCLNYSKKWKPLKKERFGPRMFSSQSSIVKIRRTIILIIASIISVNTMANSADPDQTPRSVEFGMAQY